MPYQICRYLRKCFPEIKCTKSVRFRSPLSLDENLESAVTDEKPTALIGRNATY